MPNRIKDDSGDRTYWVQTPLLIWALSQDPYDLALWFTIKAIAGEDKECILSTEDLATLSMMSVGKVSQCRARLIEFGLLEGEVRRDPEYPQPVWHLTIPDVWDTNVKWAKDHRVIKAKVDYKSLQRSEISERKKSLHQVKEATKKPSPHEGGTSPHEGGTSPHEGGTSPHEGGTSPHEANKIIYRSDQDQSKIGRDRESAISNDVSLPPPAPAQTATPDTPAAVEAPKKPLLPNDGYDIPVTERKTVVSRKRGRPNADTLSPHVKGLPFTEAGLVAEGAGTNAVAAYYEFYSIYEHKLSAMVEDRLVKRGLDLERWRAAVASWQDSDHRPTYIHGMLDWYNDPGKIATPNGAAPTAPAPKERVLDFNWEDV